MFPCNCKINMVTSHQHPVLTQLKSRHQIKAAIQQTLKFNTINLIIEHNYLTVQWVGFKRWYWNSLLIIERCMVKMRLPHDVRLQVYCKQGPSAMHLGKGGSSRMGDDDKGFPTNSTGKSHGMPALHSMHYLIKFSSAPFSQNCRLHLPGEVNKGLRVEVAARQITSRSRYWVRTERTSLELTLHNWRRDANANFPTLDSLGVFQSGAPLCQQPLAKKTLLSGDFLQSLFSLTTDRVVWESEVSYTLVCVVRHLEGQGRQRESFSSSS